MGDKMRITGHVSWKTGELVDATDDDMRKAIRDWIQKLPGSIMKFQFPEGTNLVTFEFDLDKPKPKDPKPTQLPAPTPTPHAKPKKA